MLKRLYLLLAAILLLCGMFLVSCESEELDHEHQFIEHTVKATCTEKGRREKFCKICDKTELLEVLPATGHKPNEWQTKVEPTCTVNRVDERLCYVCNVVVESKTYDLTGHNYGEFELALSATCTEMGVMKQVCKTCGADGPTKMIDKKEHNYTTVNVGATCLIGAHVRYTCTSCGESHGEEYAQPIDSHVESEDWIVHQAPTCVSDGVKKKICAVCAADLSFEPIPMNTENHSFVVETVPPTDDSEGYVKYTCKNCGHEKQTIYETNYLPSQIYEMIASATVRIEAYGIDGKLQNVGSGFFITEDGSILTNFHVIAGAYTLKVKRFGGAEYATVTVKGYDTKNDLAVLGITLQKDETVTVLRISTTGVSTGDSIYALGSPLGVDDVFTSGIVSNPGKNVNGKVCIVFTAPIAQGNSGGPLVNTRGEVVGIINTTADSAQNLNFALPISLLADVDTSAEKAVADVYAETLGENAFVVLKKYLSANYQYKDSDGRMVIERVVREESETAGGWDYRMIYDEKTGEVILNFVWISGGVDLYRAEIIIDGVKEEYAIKFYDFLWSQYTMEGTLKTDIQPVRNDEGKLDASVFGGILKFSHIAYNAQASANTLAYYTARDLFGVAYLNILEQTALVLEESGTQLANEHFNFKEIIEKVTEEPQE